MQCKVHAGTQRFIASIAKRQRLLSEAKQRFQADRFEDLYGSWRSGSLNERDLQVEFRQLVPDRTVLFETYLVKGNPSPLPVDGRQG